MTDTRKPIGWPQAMVRAGGDAMRMSGSSDWYTLARICLESALPNQRAAIDLISKTPPGSPIAVIVEEP